MTLVTTKGPDAFRTISEASDELGVPTHVLRFWETKFSFIRPMKRAGGRRFYRPRDLEVLKGVRDLLHEEGYTIKGVQRLHKEQGLKRLLVAGGASAEAVAVADADSDPDASEALADFDLADEAGSLKFVEAAVRLEPGAPEPPGMTSSKPLQPERPMLADGARQRLQAILSDLRAAKQAIDTLLAADANDVD